MSERTAHVASFRQAAAQAGFNRDQTDFMLEYLSQPGHEHTAEQITDLDEAVEEILDEREE